MANSTPKIQAEAESLMAETARNGTATIGTRMAGAEALAAKGMAVIDGDTIRLTAAGRFASASQRRSAAAGLNLPETPQPPREALGPDSTAAEHLQERDRAQRGAPPMKNTPEDRAIANDQYGIAADELRQFIERFEQLNAEKADIAAQQKELMAEAKGRGFNTKVMRLIVSRRKRKPDDLAEEDAQLDLYQTALEMN